MEHIICQKCGSKEYLIEETNIHRKASCAKCGCFIKFVKKETNIETGEIASDSQQEYARYLLNKWRESKLPLTVRQAGAIIQVLKQQYD